MEIDWGQAVLYGLVSACLCWAISLGSGPGRRISLRTFLLIAIAAGLAGPPLVRWLADMGRTISWFPEITSGKIFIGMWVALLTLTLFERKGQAARRVPIWAGALAAIVVAFGLPPLLDKLTGAYQPMSFVDDVNGCMRSSQTGDGRLAIENGCDFEITVGLCLPAEKNPQTCVQSKTLQPGETASFDPKGTAQSSLPSNLNGYTLAACRPPHRPSRTLSNIGRGYDGICIPAG